MNSVIEFTGSLFDNCIKRETEYDYFFFRNLNSRKSIMTLEIMTIASITTWIMREIIGEISQSKFDVIPLASVNADTTVSRDSVVSAVLILLSYLR